MKQNCKKIVGNGLLFAAVLALTLYAVFHGENLAAMADAFQTCDGRWLLPAVGCVILFVAGEGVVLRLLLRSLRYPIGFWGCFLVSSAGFFFSAVTPSAGGGQPMQVYFLRKEGVPVGVSAVVLMAVTITYKLVLVMVGLGLAFFRLDFLRAHFERGMFLYWLGMVLTVGWICVLVILVFHPHLARLLMDKLLGLLERSHILRHKQSLREKLLAAMDSYHDTAAYFKTHIGLMAAVQLVTFVQRFALFTVPWLVYRSFGLVGYDWADLAVLQAVISISADMLPMPGGMGISEGLFLTAFEPVFGEALALPAMVLSRGTDFYCRLILTALFTAVGAMTLGRHARRGRKRGPG